MKVLLFEDCKDRIANFKKWFAEYGIENVSYCQEAKDCIEFLKKERFDLIFLDHDMERVEHELPYDEDLYSGTVVAKWWNHPENKNLKNVPVIIHSVNEPKGVFMNKQIPNSILIRRIYHKHIFENLLRLSKNLIYNIGEIKDQ